METRGFSVGYVSEGELATIENVSIFKKPKCYVLLLPSLSPYYNLSCFIFLSLAFLAWNISQGVLISSKLGLHVLSEIFS